MGLIFVVGVVRHEKIGKNQKEFDKQRCCLLCGEGSKVLESRTTRRVTV